MRIVSLFIGDDEQRRGLRARRMMMSSSSNDLSAEDSMVRDLVRQDLGNPERCCCGHVTRAVNCLPGGRCGSGD
jgi:hypothetical protein